MKIKLNSGGILIWIIFIAVIVIIVWSQYEKKENRLTDPLFTMGIVTDKSKVAIGEQYLDYTYKVNNITYKGSVPIKFCLECSDSCCKVGSKVKVRYESGDPSNSDLVH